MKTLLGVLLLGSGVALAQNQQSTTTVQAAGTSTAQAAKPSTAFTASFVTLTEVARNDIDAYSEDIPAKTTNYLSAGMKLDAKNKIAFRAYWEHAFNQRVNGEVKSQYKTLDPRLVYSTVLPKIGKSDDIALAVQYYIPVSDSSKNTALARNIEKEGRVGSDSDLGAQYITRTQSMGTLRLDGELYYTLNPEITVGYYLNPRLKMFTNPENDSFHFIHYLVGKYNVGNTSDFYLWLGQTQLFTNVDGYRASNTVNETMELAIGYEIALLENKLYINPEISNSIATKGSEKKGDAQLMRSDEITYALTLALSL